MTRCSRPWLGAMEGESSAVFRLSLSGMTGPKWSPRSSPGAVNSYRAAPVPSQVASWPFFQTRLAAAVAPRSRPMVTLTMTMSRRGIPGYASPSKNEARCWLPGYRKSGSSWSSAEYGRTQRKVSNGLMAHFEQKKCPAVRKPAGLQETEGSLHSPYSLH